MIDEARSKFAPGEDPLVVGVSPVGTGWVPRESALLGVRTRTELLDAEAGRQLNEQLADCVPDSDVNALLDQSDELALTCLANGGEVLYLIMGLPSDYGTEHCYT